MNIYTGNTTQAEKDAMHKFATISRVTTEELMLFLIEREFIKWDRDKWVEIAEFLLGVSAPSDTRELCDPPAIVSKFISKPLTPKTPWISTRLRKFLRILRFIKVFAIMYPFTNAGWILSDICFRSPPG